MATTRGDLEEFLARTRDLCLKERMAEVEQSSLLLSNCSPKLLEQKGLALLGLGVSNVNLGLGGKSLIELERPSAYHSSPNFPPHTFRPGDIARVEANVSGTSGKRKAKPSKKQATVGGDAEAQLSVEGVIYKVSDTRVVVSVEAEAQDIELPERCRLVKLANSITFDRMDRAIDSLERLVTQQASEGSSMTRALSLAQSLLALKPLDSFASLTQALVFKDDKLNDSQKEAVKFALESPEIALIHGPPGTGKTQTLVEIIRQLVDQDKRILVCGASNLAVDNLLERLVPYEIPLTRIGHPARVLGNLHAETLDAQAARSDQAALAADAKTDLENAMSTLAGKGKARVRGAERKKMWEEVKELRKEYRKREKVIVQSVLSEAKIVLATCHSAGGRQLANLQFDVVCIDEACQALEAVCWIPILKGSKLILAGDPLQLPPTIVSSNQPSRRNVAVKDSRLSESKVLSAGKKPIPAAKSTGVPSNSSKESDVHFAANSDDDTLAVSITSIQPLSSKKPPRLVPPKSLEVTLFQRLEQMYGPSIKRMLTTQYRMHKKIAEFPSETLYGSQLVSHESVASHLLRDLPGISSDQELVEVTSEPVVFFDTAGCEFYEKVDSEHGDEGSRSNENEAVVVRKWVEELVSTGLNPSQIAIITPYQAQVTLLVSMLRPTYAELEIGTVDGMQGREKEAIILSLVRSNDKREVGFLKEKRRLNVAMTRPRRHLCVVGDSSTVEKGGNYLKRWMAWLENNADVRYAGDP